MLHHVELVLDHVEPADAIFEAVRQFAKQRRGISVFEQVKFGDDVVALFARPDEINKALEALAA